MVKRDYSRIDILENTKKERTLTAEEILELKELKWCKYEREYKAKEENRTKPRQCSICNETVPFFQLQNHKLLKHKETTYCCVCDIEVKYFANHCKSKKHRDNFMFNKPVYINSNETKQDEIPPPSKEDTIAEEAE